MSWFTKHTARRRDELLSAYMDGQLSSRERAEVERRLAESPAWRSELESLRAMVALVRQAPRVQPRRSFALAPDMVRSETPRRKSRPPVRPIMSVVTAAAALFLAFSVTGGATHLFSEPATRPPLFGSGASEAAPRMQAVPSTLPAPEGPTSPEGSAGSVGPAGPAGPSFAAKDRQPAASPTALPSPMATGLAGPQSMVAPAPSTPSPAPAPTPTAGTAGGAAPPRNMATESGIAASATAPADSLKALDAGEPAASTWSAPTAADQVKAMKYSPEPEGARDRVPWVALEIAFGALTGILGAATLWLFRNTGTRF